MRLLVARTTCLSYGRSINWGHRPTNRRLVRPQEWGFQCLTDARAAGLNVVLSQAAGSRREGPSSPMGKVARFCGRCGECGQGNKGATVLRGHHWTWLGEECGHRVRQRAVQIKHPHRRHRDTHGRRQLAGSRSWGGSYEGNAFHELSIGGARADGLPSTSGCSIKEPPQPGHALRSMPVSF